MSCNFDYVEKNKAVLLPNYSSSINIPTVKNRKCL